MKYIATPLFAFSLMTISALSLSGCQTAPQTEEKPISQIQTEVFYLDRSMLPPQSELTVSLEDVSKMDVAATLISSKSVTLSTAPPYRVTLDYDNALIKENMRYNVRAQIKKDGKLLYTSTEANNPFLATSDTIKIKVSKVAANVKPDVSLENTYWKALKLNGEKIVTPEGARELHLQLKPDNQIRGFAGCNNFMGQYIAKEFGLRFSKVATTMMMCQDQGNALEQSMHQVLQDTFEYQIKGESLTLFNELKQPIGVFKAVYF